MRNVSIFLGLVVLLAFGCRKNEKNVSTEVTYSVPTITLTNGNYYSIPVGGSLPAIPGVAYDTFYNEYDSIIINQSTLNNTAPGLNTVIASAKNKYGMTAYDTIFVAVTSISSAINLAGMYRCVTNNDSVTLAWLANGFYMINNVGGVSVSSGNTPVPALLIQQDNTTMLLPYQNTIAGALYGTNGMISMSPLDTTFQYVIQGNQYFPSGTPIQFLKLN